MFLVSAKPEEGSLRLVGGQKPSEGRVEIFHAGHWGTICDDGMNNIDAAVICRQLSYSGQSFALKNAAFGEGGGVIWLDNVRCTGKESRLVDCFHRHWMDVACRDSEVISVVCNSTNVLEGSVRLVDGLVDSEGRVEIFHSGIWGTVCGDDFTETVAKIVCQQLGYSGLSLAFGNALFGEGGGVIWMHGIRCSGTESNITSCLRRPWGTSQCKHKQDASVVCHASKGVDGSVRLVGGKRRSEGRVEVFYAGNWGTVCVDKHNMGAATVICRQLGYYRESILLTKSVFKPGKDRIWLDGVGCSGLESNITDCRHRSWGDSRCDHSDDSAVMCDVLPVSRDSKVRRRIAYIDFYTDPRYTQETSEPFQLGSRAYVEVVARMREDVKLLVNNCTMSSDRAGNNDVIPLVRNRYAASNSVHMIGSSDRFTRFYVDVQQNNAYINCEVSFCNSFDFSPPCQNGCHRQCP